MITNAAHENRLCASGFPFTSLSKKKEYTEVNKVISYLPLSPLSK